MQEVDNDIHRVVYENFQDSNKHMKLGMILGMYRILGVAAVLIGMTASMQDYHDYENYIALRAVNMYSFFLPIFSILYDMQLPSLIGRRERRFNMVCKYVFVTVYWIYMVIVSIIVLVQPWKTEIVY
jgi:hypothetical protein